MLFTWSIALSVWELSPHLPVFASLDPCVHWCQCSCSASWSQSVGGSVNAEMEWVCMLCLPVGE